MIIFDVRGPQAKRGTDHEVNQGMGPIRRGSKLALLDCAYYVSFVKLEAPSWVSLNYHLPRLGDPSCKHSSQRPNVASFL